MTCKYTCGYSYEPEQDGSCLPGALILLVGVIVGVAAVLGWLL